MHLSSSKTQLFYHLIDLDEEARQQHLKQLEQDSPELYRQLSSLLADDAYQQQLTQLLHLGLKLTTQPDNDLSGVVINNYRVLHELGRGGIGVVYAVEHIDETWQQSLAMKFIQRSLSHVLGPRALLAEAKLLARLNHPFIAKLYDSGLHHGSVFIVIERVLGQPLDRFLCRSPLPYDDKLRLFNKICQAVDHAHQHQVLHADLKPGNILIDAEHQPKLIDFNLTQQQHRHADDPIAGLSAFSPKFASPEQKKGRPLSKQSDVYSLGKILELMFPSPPWRLDIDRVIRRATRPNTQQRYTTVQHLQNDIERILIRRPPVQKKNSAASEHMALDAVPDKPVTFSLPSQAHYGNNKLSSNS